jgi:hypothetical protein
MRRGHLSFDGVEYEMLEHALTPEQVRIYDSYAGAFQVIHAHLDAALEASGNISGIDHVTLERTGPSRQRDQPSKRQAAFLQSPDHRNADAKHHSGDAARS